MSEIKIKAGLYYPTEYLEVVNTIEEWDGDIKDAVESLATRGGIEGVEAGHERWFDDFVKHLNKLATFKKNIEDVVCFFKVERALATRLVIACFLYWEKSELE